MDEESLFDALLLDELLLLVALSDSFNVAEELDAELDALEAERCSMCVVLEFDDELLFELDVELLALVEFVFAVTARWSVTVVVLFSVRPLP